MEIMIKCSETEKSKWLEYNKRRCPFAPCFPQTCGEGAKCDKCIEDNVEFDIEN